MSVSSRPACWFFHRPAGGIGSVGWNGGQGGEGMGKEGGRGGGRGIRPNPESELVAAANSDQFSGRKNETGEEHMNDRGVEGEGD